MHRETDPTWGRWTEVNDLLDQALDRSPDEQRSFVVEACASDPELAGAVLGLLHELDACGDRFETPGADLLEAAFGAPRGPGDLALGTLRPGDRVGRYRILHELGRGGMATVYEAERADGDFEHRVAVKVIRLGLDTEEVVRRFLAERRILSQLSHANIARLLDGGATEDGRPFLVMERVEGTPLVRWADEGRLSIERRLDLFLELADAVHFAHRRLVVHRDLKPSNVLVDSEGRVKLLDFGIAKLLDAEPGAETLTEVGGPQPLTPAFASPEQLMGAPVTTASDVYQLGVLLHILLTGHLPTGSGAARGKETTPCLRPSDLVRPTRRSAPEGSFGDGDTEHDAEQSARNRGTTVAALRRTLRGDLDTIVLTALRPEPEERYASAEAMAGDVRRVLAGRTIAARPPSLLYRARKFHARNPWVGPLTAALALSLVGYLHTLVSHAAELERERNEARSEAQRADELRAFLVGLFRMADPYETPEPGRSREIRVADALAVGTRRVREELADRPDLEVAMLTTIADVYMNLDDYEAAEPILAEALAVHRRTGGGLTPWYASLLGGLTRVTAHTVGVDSAASIAERWVRAEIDLNGPDDPRVADALLTRSNEEYNLSRYEAALRDREEAVRIQRDAGPGSKAALASTLDMLADSYRDAGRLGEAVAAAREALRTNLELRGPEHPRTAQSRVHLAQALHAAGRLKEAAQEYREALPILERTLGPDHSETLSSWNNLGIVLTDLEDYEGAEEVHLRILAQRRGPDGDVRDLAVAGSLQNLAAVLVRRHRWIEADSLAREALGIYQEEAPSGSSLPALPLLTLAEIRLATGRAVAAEEEARNALRILEHSLPTGHYVTAVARCRLGLSLARQDRRDEAAPLVRQAMDALQAWEGAPPRLVRECADTQEELAGHR